MFYASTDDHKQRYLFNTMGYGIRWPSPGNYGGVNFHGMFMSTAMVFFQGEGTHVNSPQKT
ncbi:hypothetical protein ANCCEY_15106 [Ancylostoma ceylanicum]|uniref:Uncharacterized protein n=1 Tax=Ancylostoma ceylanicum TaxID=53326 RepID=A0A0D6L899_9BILA|nr:hypothetical protein ANCCEY_15106 [Ancylostoma ceylanicum]